MKSDNVEIDEKDIDNAYVRLKKEAEESGYHLNPDIDHTKGLIEGLLLNERRYGYWACPCRLASEKKEEDLDIICPCDYRDADLNEFDACYCGLYVSDEIVQGKKELEPIPERRPEKKDRLHFKNIDSNKKSMGLSHHSNIPIWRCRVCGYLCARDQPPNVCPICKAKKERFELFSN